MRQICFLLFLLLPLTTYGQASYIFTFAGTGHTNCNGDGGPAISACLWEPRGLAVDDIGNVYVADEMHSRIRKIDTNGIITTLAGDGTNGYSGDGGLATNAQLYFPLDVTIDRFRNIYIADHGNNVVRKVDTNGVITTVAGNGFLAGTSTGAYGGDGGPATSAKLYAPHHVDVDDIGNIYIADLGNHRIRKVDSNGIITTIAGTGIIGYSGDGVMATSANITDPISARIDRYGNVYFVDGSRIRKINTLGVLSTIAGTNIVGYSGDGGMAVLAKISPAGLKIDTSGNIYFAQRDCDRIRKIDTAGIITTIAGNGSYGFSGDGGYPLLSKLAFPYDVAMNKSGDLFISEAGNDRIRVVTSDSVGFIGTPVEVRNEQASVGIFDVYPNPATEELVISTKSEINRIVLTSVLGHTVYDRAYHSSRWEAINISQLPPGIYIVKINSEYVRWIVKQ